jgi:DNA repair photolyase
MSKVNKSKGNMYDWVSHTWSPLIGCPHQCSYCYVKTYQDLPVAPRLDGSFPNLGSGRIMFIGHLCDMFAADFIVDPEAKAMVNQILDHCMQFDNTYVLQTKNPVGLSMFKDQLLKMKFILGTTIETNRESLVSKISKAPSPSQRAVGFQHVREAMNPQQSFITIEPILDCDVIPLVELIQLANPTFVNIGADSKGHGLEEPSYKTVAALAEALGAAGIEIRKKLNLDRLINQENEK